MAHLFSSWAFCFFFLLESLGITSCKVFPSSSVWQWLDMICVQKTMYFGDLCDVYLGTLKFETLERKWKKKRKEKKESLTSKFDVLLISRMLRSILYCACVEQFFLNCFNEVVSRLFMHLSCTVCAYDHVYSWNVSLELHSKLKQHFKSAPSVFLSIFFLPELFYILSCLSVCWKKIGHFPKVGWVSHLESWAQVTISLFSLEFKAYSGTCLIINGNWRNDEMWCLIA